MMKRQTYLTEPDGSGEQLASWTTVDSMAAAQVARRPEATVLLAPGREPLTFAELQGLIQWMGLCLADMGVKRQARVAVVLPNGPEMAAAFLGVASAAVCAPLNPGYTEAEFQFYLEDIHAKALLAGGEVPAATRVAERLGIAVVRLEPDLGGPAGAFTFGGRYPAPAGPTASSPDDVALVLHTSGTTSQPKIVPLTHRNLTQSAWDIAHSLDLGEGDRCLNMMPLFHIHGLAAALLATLSSGASVVCTPGFDAARFFSWLGDFRPTWYTAVPTMHQAILARAQSQGPPEHSLRFIRSCSSALAPAVMQQLEDTFRIPVVEAYGMTEASHQMATNRLPPGVRKPGSVGLPAGPKISVIDGEGNLVAPGATGEIVIRGVTVTRGYENNPAANASAFHKGWFRTGDQGHFDEDGFLYISGRIKELINRGGEKISPREVDEILLQHPAVQQAVCFAVPHRQLGEEVGAAIVLRPGSEDPGARKLREFAAQRLASFKVPRVILVVKEIPKGPTGKLQRIGLAAKLGIEPMDDMAPIERSGGDGPRTTAERQIANIWAGLLSGKEPGLHDSFLALGGSSLQVVAMLSRVSRDLGVDISLVSFLDRPTIAGLLAEVSWLQAAKRDRSWSTGSLIPIQAEGTSTPLFCAAGHDAGAGLFSPFAEALGPSQPLFGFPPPSIDVSHPAYSIPDLASQYVRQMREVQPKGPYHLLGICHGGFVVYEMARRLQQQGEIVAFLGMIDAFYAGGVRPPLRRELARHARRLARRFRFLREQVEHATAGGRISFVLDRAEALAERTRHRLELRVYCWHLSNERTPPASLCQLRYANTTALRAYVPGPYHGDIDLFRIADNRPDDPSMGWAGLVDGKIRVHDSPGHHRGILAEPAYRLMAAQVRECMRAVQA